MDRIGATDGRQYSGTITLRSTAELRRRVAVGAERAGVSVNTYVEADVRQGGRDEERGRRGEGWERPVPMCGSV